MSLVFIQLYFLAGVSVPGPTWSHEPQCCTHVYSHQCHCTLQWQVVIRHYHQCHDAWCWHNKNKYLHSINMHLSFMLLTVFSKLPVTLESYYILHQHLYGDKDITLFCSGGVVACVHNTVYGATSARSAVQLYLHSHHQHCSRFTPPQPTWLLWIHFHPSYPSYNWRCMEIISYYHQLEQGIHDRVVYVIRYINRKSYK